MDPSTRKLVIFVGPKQSPEFFAEFMRRGLSLAYCDVTRARTLLPRARGIIFAFNPSAKGELRTNLSLVVREALDQGLLVTAFLPVAEHVWIVPTLSHLRLQGRVRLATDGHVIAQLTAEHDPGMGENAQVDVECEEVLTDECSLLLRRAFSDCRRIKVRHLPTGRSADAVFCVFAVFRAQRAGGTRPLPFFVKLDSIEKIRREKDKYERLVYPFVPFHLRPNVEAKRCVLGQTMGLLVADFVEQSESLWEVLRRGQGQQVLYSLFDQALRGWRLQAFSGLRDALPQDRERSERLIREGLIRTDRYDAGVIERARELGATRSPEQMLELLSSIDRFHSSTGPAHRDLHAGNIRVRGNDAILIDFNAAERAPLVADPAMLEVSLVFGVHSNDETNVGWYELVDRLYESRNMDQAPPPATEPDPREWLWSAVRQIRLIGIASQLVDAEYKIAVAILLFRHAGFPVTPDDAVDRDRRAYAYVISERLAEQVAPLLTEVANAN